MIVTYADAQSILGIPASTRFQTIVEGVNKYAEDYIGRFYDKASQTERLQVFDNQTMIRVSKRLPLNSLTSMRYADESDPLTYTVEIEQATGTIWLISNVFYKGLLIVIYNGGFQYSDMPKHLVSAVIDAINFSWRFRDFNEVRSERMGDRTVSYQTGRSGLIKIPDSSIEVFNLQIV